MAEKNRAGAELKTGRAELGKPCKRTDDGIVKNHRSDLFSVNLPFEPVAAADPSGNCRLPFFQHAADLIVGGCGGFFIGQLFSPHRLLKPGFKTGIDEPEAPFFQHQPGRISGHGGSQTQTAALRRDLEIVEIRNVAIESAETAEFRQRHGAVNRAEGVGINLAAGDHFSVRIQKLQEEHCPAAVIPSGLADDQTGPDMGSAPDGHGLNHFCVKRIFAAAGITKERAVLLRSDRQCRLRPFRFPIPENGFRYGDFGERFPVAFESVRGGIQRFPGRNDDIVDQSLETYVVIASAQFQRIEVGQSPAFLTFPGQFPVDIQTLPPRFPAQRDLVP